ncbi:ribosome hibernation-promoting factor, HPF/YfiA family [Propioniciclava soli]|uniref:Ribosome hibernation promoting factor n=1 Tax=Propioniciclava soli TaxID=2775081 RepID=A0ABZ3CAK6_9ACTN|nr:ribosome-associated translation inhibitor RaiA [Propioniciclava soli]
MDVIVTGRRCTINDDFRERVTERIASIERFRDRVQRVEVQVSAHPHKQPDHATSVEITLYGRGPVVRSEAAADDKSMAFEHALDRLKAQLRRAADRRKVHRGLRVAETLEMASAPVETPAVDPDAPPVQRIGGLEITGDGPLVVREKIFPATPLTLAQALDEMELVGHDFFLYVDAESGAPSVVYRRKAYDYGVIHLDLGQKE